MKISERPTSPEESIYETTSDHLESEFSEKDLNSNLNFTYSPTEKKVKKTVMTRDLSEKNLITCFTILSFVLLEMMPQRYPLK